MKKQSLSTPLSGIQLKAVGVYMYIIHFNKRFTTQILLGEKPQRKRRGCMECAGCKREDCGTCQNCKDMVKFGGPGRKKQKCALRVCLSQQSDSKGKCTLLTQYIY